MNTSTQTTYVRNILIGIGLLAILAIVAFYFSDNEPAEQPQDRVPLLAVLSEVSDQSWFSLKEVHVRSVESALPEFDGKVVDYARNGGSEVLIYDDSGIHAVQMRYDNSGDWHVISRSPYEKREVAVAQSGDYIAYAERDRDVTDSLQLDAWTIYLFDRTSKELYTIGAGYQPQFLTFGSGDNIWEALVFSSQNGVGMFNLNLVAADEAEPQIYEGVIPESTHHPVLFSKRINDGEAYALAYDSVAGAYNVFSVSKNYLGLSAREQVQADELLGITNNLLYFSRNGELYVHRIGGTEEPKYVMDIENEQGQRIIAVLDEVEAE
ncbi:MAG: hypothetical protein ACJKTH_02645 [Patescibacteria group bacterium UBA2163]